MQAKRNLSSQVWDFLSGGAESETTLKRNRYALGFLGAASVSQLGRDHLAAVTPMTVPHPLSPYPVFMESLS